MERKSAWDLVHEYYRKSAPTEEDDFLFVEATEYLIGTQGDNSWNDNIDYQAYYYNLGSFYYKKGQFALAQKCFEQGVSYGCGLSSIELGNIWYYGLTGTVDYQRAYECFSAELWNLRAAWKLADLFRYGHYVKQDMEEYRRRIETLFERIEDCCELDRFPEICMRRAELFQAEGTALACGLPLPAGQKRSAAEIAQGAVL